jgi:hypothetical protein
VSELSKLNFKSAGRGYSTCRECLGRLLVGCKGRETGSSWEYKNYPSTELVITSLQPQLYNARHHRDGPVY